MLQYLELKSCRFLRYQLCCYLGNPIEVGTGIEPAYAALQAAASPLGHPTLRVLRADDGIRTRDPHLGKVVL